MRHGLRPGFMRVIDEVALREEPGILGDDFHAILVGANRTVSAKAVEHRARDRGSLNREAWIEFQARVADIIVDADGETGLRRS